MLLTIKQQMKVLINGSVILMVCASICAYQATGFML